MSEPTGRIETGPAGHRLVLQRTFAAPIDDVWAAITEPARLERWVGTFTGDPATGVVSFRMTAEGDDVEAGEMTIRACEPPSALRVTTGGAWGFSLDLDLVEVDGVTTLTFTQPGIDPAQAPSVGPGWEYYLDRLVAAETGADLAAIDFDRDYYPAMAEHYTI